VQVTEALRQRGQRTQFIVADPHQRIYDNRVSLASLGINVRGRSRRLTINYRTTVSSRPPPFRASSR
jgi:hypothetical protein